MIGIIRIYSLIDLGLLLWVVRAPKNLSLLGGLLLWLSFLFYLEWRHRHSYRPSVSSAQWVLPLVVGAFLFPAYHSVAFVAASYVYCKKNQSWYSLLSPLMRGAQTCALVLGVGGSWSIATIAAAAISARNLLGDIRDAYKDREEGMRTIPVILGQTMNVRYVHLLGTMATTLLWSIWGGIPLSLLALIWFVQIATYNLTPR